MSVEVVSFRSGSDSCRGWYYRPTTPGPHPVVVLSHGYSTTHVFHYWRTAQALSGAGYAVLDYDPRRLGASGGAPRQAISLPDQIEDLRAAVTFARTLDGVDPARVVLYGSSSGGGVAAGAAAADPSLAALLLIVPMLDGSATMPGLPLSARLRLMRGALLDRVGRLAGRDPLTIPAFGDPGTTALITRDDVMAAIAEEVHPDGHWSEHGRRYLGAGDDGEYVNAVAMWETLQMLTFRPGRRLGEVSAPTLMVIGTHDTVTPPGPLRRAARNTAVEVVELPVNHFGPFRPSVAFDEVLALQLGFLDRVLGDREDARR